MSKSKKSDFYDDYEDDDLYGRADRNRQSKRKEKQINRALRTKDIDTLLKLEEDEDY